MSGQFEQRRLARPSFQLDVLDAFCGERSSRRRRDARSPGPSSSLRDGTTTSSPATRTPSRSGSPSCRRSSTRPRACSRRGGAASSPGASACGTSRSSRRRHPLLPRRSRPRRARAPLRSQRGAERALAPLERIAPELARGGRGAPRSRGPAGRGRHATSTASSASLDAEPGALEQVEERLQDDRRSQAALRGRRRTRRCSSAAAARERARRGRAAATRSRRGRARRRGCEARRSISRTSSAKPRETRRPRVRRCRRAELALARDGGGRVPRRAPRARGPARPGATR